MRKIIIHTVCLLLILSINACDKDYSSSLQFDKNVTFTKFSINGTEAKIDELKKTIVIKVADGTDLSKMTPIFTLAEGATITPALVADMDFTKPLEVKVVNGDVYSKYTISVTEEFFIGFLGSASSVSGIKDDDEKAAAAWFFSEYENGVYISFDEIKNGAVDLNNFRVLWWYYDESSTLPTTALDDVVIEKITNYYKAGGNMLLNSHACGYLWKLGRITNNYSMTIGDGEGFDNGDTWSIGASIGSHAANEHPIYNGISFNTDPDGYKWVPIISGGWKEDHNHVIVEIAAFHGLSNGDENAYTAFTTQNHAKWLGVWSGIRDYFMVGVAEFLPTDEYKGRAIYQGIGGFEFNVNEQGEINPDGLNTFQNNIETITKNSLNYLSLKN